MEPFCLLWMYGSASFWFYFVSIFIVVVQGTTWDHLSTFQGAADKMAEDTFGKRRGLRNRQLDITDLFFFFFFLFFFSFFFFSSFFSFFFFVQ